MIQAKHSVIQSFVQKKGFRHKSKDASKKNMQKDTIWGKKKIQANKQSDAFVKKNV